MAIELEKVKEIEEDRESRSIGPSRVVDSHPALQALEARLRALEGDDLPVCKEGRRRLSLQGRRLAPGRQELGLCLCGR